MLGVKIPIHLRASLNVGGSQLGSCFLYAGCSLLRRVGFPGCFERIAHGGVVQPVAIVAHSLNSAAYPLEQPPLFRFDKHTYTADNRETIDVSGNFSGFLFVNKNQGYLSSTS
ncbi:hypothetical protein BH24DEI2_BH24DEI2_13500 [soil metagenome]